jgi:hypothetical protein
MTNKQITALVFLSIAILVFVFYFNIRTAISMSQPNQNEISAGWQQVCTWLRTQTDAPANYYDEDSKPVWGVFSWWDYGYWITREGQRPAVTNPGSASRYAVAHYLVSDNYSETHTALAEKKVKYVVIDYLMVTNKYYAIYGMANEYDAGKFLPTRFQQDYSYWNADTQMPVMLNYEDYYRSLVVRLYNFNGQAIRSPGTPVFQVDADRTIKGLKDFVSLEEAKAFQEKNGGIIAGSDPFLSPWEIKEPVEGFKLVFESPSKVKIGNWTYSEVKIFEVLP